MPLPWLIAGAALGVGSGIAKYLSGQADADERRERFKEYLKFSAEEEAKTLKAGSRRIGEFFTRRIRGAQSGAARRAKSLGLANSTESFSVPAEAVVAEQGREAVKGFESETNLKFAQDRLRAGRDFADRPIEPNEFDLLGGILEGGSRFATSFGVESALSEPNPLTGENASLAGGGTSGITMGSQPKEGALTLRDPSASKGLSLRSSPEVPDNPLEDIKRQNPEIFGLNRANSFSRASFSPFRLSQG